MSTITYERTPAQKKIDEKVLERVKRGLKWLEETHGTGWEDKIDLKTLNLRCGETCVLGQVYGEAGANYGRSGYGYALDHFFYCQEMEDYGFDISMEEQTWNELQNAWEYVLTPLVKHDC
jgi:hypothetical protein